MIDQSFSLQDVDSSQVMSEQIGRCSRVFDCNLRFWVWMVESENDEHAEYKTWWHDGPHCTCQAGQIDFRNCRDGVCKHIRWIAAADLEQIAALAAIDEQIEADAQTLHKLSIDGKCPTQKVAQRILCAPHTPVVKDISTSQITANRPFSLLR